MNFPGAYYIYLLFGSQYYHDDHPAHQGDDPKVPISARDFTCSDFPYVSCNRDTNSAEWKQARDVRLAMNTAIDREALVNNIFAGNGSPFYISWWLGHEGRIKEFGLDKLKWDYDPTKAQDLLKGAGYPDGIDIDITIHPGFQPGSNVAAEAVIGMWEDIGVRTTVNRTPYSVYRPNLIRRTTSTLLNLTDVPYVEAYRLYSPAFNPSSGFNFGIEHPVLTDYINKASDIVDDDQRWAVMAEAAKWLFDNSLHIPLFEVNSVWPLGPELDPWETLGINRGWLSNYEFAPHRQ
jgi:peptide/nickel transport system substrate-binding protein